MHPAIYFARKLLLDDHGPSLWIEEIPENSSEKNDLHDIITETYRVKPADCRGKVLVLGLGSRSPQARWIPLPKYDDFLRDWQREKRTDFDWEAEKKCVCIILFVVRL